MSKKSEGFIEWVAPFEPPQGGVLINSRTYLFPQRPEFLGRRIEKMRFGSAGIAARRRPDLFKEVDVFEQEFADKIFWTRVAANADQVRAFLDKRAELSETSEVSPPEDSEPKRPKGRPPKTHPVS